MVGLVLPESWRPFVVSKPQIVLSGPQWRVVRVELPDANGVLRPEYLMEMTEPRAVDAMGVQQWSRLTDKSAYSDWVRLARRFLDELLKHAGEIPDADHREGR
jgi:hypothetical protein